MIGSFSTNLANLFGTVLIWTFAGIIFGSAFAALYEFWLTLDVENWLALIWSVILAGTVTASFFGSLVVALAGTLTGILVAISYQLIFSGVQLPGVLMLIAFALGLVSGGFFSRRELEEYQPLGQAGSGFLAGLVAGLLLALIHPFVNIDSSNWELSAIAVSMVGIGYIFIARHIPLSVQKGTMLKVGGPIVCAVISLGVTFAFWLIGESLDMHWGEESVSRYFNILVNVPSGALGGAIGGALGGFSLTLLGIKLERHLYAD